jgi:hypothetical protein
MSMCVYSVFVLFCVYVAVLRRADPPSKESYRLCIELETEEALKAHKGCRDIDRWRHLVLGDEIVQEVR